MFVIIGISALELLILVHHFRLKRIGRLGWWTVSLCLDCILLGAFGLAFLTLLLINLPNNNSLFLSSELALYLHAMLLFLL